ncbi:MAG: DUF11 domain-containing protein [Calothrix sp. C42_A2020_038]|nr:DUF11 domain-containing protein [Calothrix sp. C42_A2020_038]
MALTQGDIAIIAYNADGNDDFAWVALVDIPANTTINFTDSSWQDTGFRTTEHLDAAGGGPLVWTHTSAITAGTVIRFSGNITTPSWSIGTRTGTGLNLAAGGDQIFVYTGTNANPTFIYGAHFATPTNWLASGSNSTNTSNIPPGLSVAAGTAFYVGDFDNGYYTGITTGTKAQLLAAISNTANWTRNDTGPLPSANWVSTFTVTAPNNPPTDLSLSATSVDENVDANTVIGTFTTTDPDNGNTHTYSLVTGAGDTDNTAFTIDGDTLKINVSPDFETKSSYNIRVRTTDQGGLSYEEALTITVNDIDETIVLNEISVNPPSTDNPFEYIEIKGAPNQTLNNLYFVAIEGDSGTPNPGTADMVVNLSGLKLGSNGLLVITSPIGGHTIPAATTKVTDSQLNNSGGGLENGTNSFLLISSPTPITEGVDYDTNNDGILELPAGATIIDAIGWTDGGVGDIVYGGVVLTQSSGTPDAATRFPNNTTSNSAAAWYNGSLAGSSNSSVTYGSNTSANLPTGAVLTPGNVNFGGALQPDLTISSLTDSPDPVVVGNALTYTLVVNNTGNGNASGVSVQFTLPNGVTYNSAGVSNGFTASQSGNVVTFSGGNINASSNATLTINVTPTATGTLTSGNAVVDPGNTIAESNEANNTIAGITTTVNAASNATPTIQQVTTTQFISLPVIGSGAVSGVINDPTDPTKTLGIDFAIADADTPVGNLTVTATSSNTSVVSNANLTLTGTGANRNLKINPTGVGYTNITVTVTDGSTSSSYTINYAASAASVNPNTTNFHTGASDASTAIAIDANYMFVADDEDQKIRLYDRNNSGLPIASFDFTSFLGLTDISGGVPREVDIEASTKVGNRIYWLGSLSNATNGNSRPNRSRIFATDISGSGAATTLTYVGRYDNLRADLIAWGDANGYNFTASAASGNIPEDPELDGFNVEGLTIAPNGTTAYVAFRAPNVPTSSRTKALIAPISNFADLVTGAATSANIGAPIELDLGGRGIRSIERNSNGEYLIVAGPADAATGTAPKDFRFYTWTGNAADAPVLRAANLTALQTGGSIESIVEVPNNLSGTTQIEVLVDNGDTVFYNDGNVAKDLQDNFQKFRSEIITLGNPVVPTRIRDIQGTAHISPLVGQRVTDVAGIVTAVRSNGFYYQDPNPDNDDRTSEGIFVFTSSAPTVAVGDSILVSGNVTEFRPGNNSNNLTITQITSPTIVKLSSGNPLPAAIILGNGGRAIPTQVINNDAVNGNVENAGTLFDPEEDGIDFYESLEGMRVQINNAVAVSPTNNFGEIWVLADNGANATGRTARGGIGIIANDFNPERIQIDPIGTAPIVNVGATFDTITGIVDYSFNNYEVIPTSLTVTSPGSLTREVTNLTSSANQLTVATFNVENLDPGDGAAKFNTLADRIVNNLKSPDILTLEEIQDNNGPTNDSVVDATLTYQTLINAIAAAGGPTYQFRQINPVDDQDGGEPGGNIRVGFLYNPNRVEFVDRPGGGSLTNTTVSNVGGVPQLSASPGRIDPTNTAFNASRKPLVGEFKFNGQTVFIIGNHFNSKGGDNPLYGPTQPPVLTSETQRNLQATIVKNFVESILAIDANANVIVMGDLNDFEFSNPLTILESAGLSTLIETLPQNERYTYNFQGNAQSLDHILVSNSLLSQLDGFDVVHINSEFADQISDHDPSVARFNIAAAGVTITQSGGNTTVAEGGATDTYTIVLNSRPTSDVTITLNPGTQLSTGANTLIFTNANWNVAQTVTVSAIDDAIVEGNHTGTITHTVTSADTKYNGINVASVTAAITDNDIAGVTITQSGGNTAVIEGGATDTYTIVLNSQPTSDVNITLNPGTQLSTGANTLTFTNANWNVAQTVTVSAIDDAIVEGNHTGAIMHTVSSSDTNYNGISLGSVNVFITDNDSTTGVNVTGTSGNDIITTGSGRDNINGGDGDDIITGGIGADILTGGAGNDFFVYTNIRDGGDTITDFEVGQDKLVFTQLLDSLVRGGYEGANAITDGYVKVVQGTSTNNYKVQIDADGPTGRDIFRDFITVNVVSGGSLNNPNNFVF